MNLAFEVVFRILEAIFVIGLVGCLFVIPQTAYMMFKVLVGGDDGSPEEPSAPPSSGQPSRLSAPGNRKTIPPLIPPAR
jgi:hypothetical protein